MATSFLLSVFTGPTKQVPEDEVLLAAPSLPKLGEIVSLPSGGRAIVAAEEFDLPQVSWRPTMKHYSAFLIIEDSPEDLVELSSQEKTEDLCQRIEAMTARRRSFRVLESFLEEAASLESQGVPLDEALERSLRKVPAFFSL